MDNNNNPHKWRDAAWKAALTEDARSAIEYFMPGLAEDMDPSRGISSISGEELPVIGSDTDKGMRISDVFFNVPLLGGDERNVALLVEQQDAHDENFGLRMFELYIRLREKTRKRTTALAIFTGRAKPADRFIDTCYGVELSFKYNIFYLRDKNIDKLREDKRTFARIALAGRLALAAGDNVPRREKYAREILDTTTELKHGESGASPILRFSKRIFRLNDPEISDELKEAYKMKLISLEEASKQILLEEAMDEGIVKGKIEGMEEGMVRGIVKGKIEGKIDVARKLLDDGFSVEAIRKYTNLDEEDIAQLV